jgi:hypothetical protein
MVVTWSYDVQLGQIWYRWKALEQYYAMMMIVHGFEHQNIELKLVGPKWCQVQSWARP